MLIVGDSGEKSKRKNKETRASAFTFLNRIDHFGTFFAPPGAKNPGCMGEQHPEGMRPAQVAWASSIFVSA
jgi:hypothetical protein